MNQDKNPSTAQSGLTADELSLAARLDAIGRANLESAPELAAVMERFIQQLKAADAGASAPQIGEAFPAFCLPDSDGALRSSDEFFGRAPAAVIFLRGHWCPYCRAVAAVLGELAPAFEARGASVIAISPETPRFTAILAGEMKHKFPILSDVGNGFALSIGLGVALDEEAASALTKCGDDISAYHGDEDWVMPIPAVFAIGPDGVIRDRYVDADYRKRMDVQRLLSALE